jgi:hypothetical protein
MKISSYRSSTYSRRKCEDKIPLSLSIAASGLIVASRQFFDYAFSFAHGERRENGSVNMIKTEWFQQTLESPHEAVRSLVCLVLRSNV